MLPETSIVSIELKGPRGIELPDTNELRVKIAAKAANEMIFFINF